MYVDSLDITIRDESGELHNPISNKFAEALVHDEKKTKQQEVTNGGKIILMSMRARTDVKARPVI